MAESVKQLPAALAEKVSHSIAFTSVTPPAGFEQQFAQLKQKAYESFQHGTALSMRMIMIVAFAAALTILILAPNKVHEID